jgi:hypothetical protein
VKKHVTQYKGYEIEVCQDSFCWRVGIWPMRSDCLAFEDLHRLFTSSDLASAQKQAAHRIDERLLAAAKRRQ